MKQMKSSSDFFLPTRFACLESWQSRLIFFALVAIIGTGFLCCNQLSPINPKGDDGDAALYLRIVERIHENDNYYKVVGSELRSRGYATRPFFNWRLPLLACCLGKMPSPEIGKWILTLLTLLTLAMWMHVLAEKGGFYMALLGSLLLTGAPIFSLTNKAFLFHEMWAGVFIAFSIAVYQHNRILSITSGLIALFIRELSLPFAVIMFFMAYKDKHKKEAVVWLIGILTFFVYLAIHAKIVSNFMTESELANKTWLQLGGWQFVLSTAKWSLPSFLTPIWIDAVLLPLSILGLWGWNDKIGTRAALTISAYISAFLIVGRNDNYYWGLMYSNLMAIGLIYAPPCLLDLYKTGFKTRT